MDLLLTSLYFFAVDKRMSMTEKETAKKILGCIEAKRKQRKPQSRLEAYFQYKEDDHILGYNTHHAWRLTSFDKHKFNYIITSTGDLVMKPQSCAS